MKKTTWIVLAVLAVTGAAQGQYRCQNIAPPSLLAPAEVSASLYQDRADFVLLQWDVVEGVGYYRVYREISINYRPATPEDSTEATLVELENPRPEWAPWAKVDAAPGEKVGRAIVATLDNVRTTWGVAAATREGGVERLSPIAVARWRETDAPTAVETESWGQIKAGLSE